MADRALALVVDTGKALLENGGEVFRAQSTMEIMAHSLGVQDFHVYVLTNGIFASAAGGTATMVRHIPAVATHLGRVEALNALSRELTAGRLDLPGAEAALHRALAMPGYNTKLALLAGVLGSGCFAFLFGGGAPEVLAAALAGAAALLLTSAGRRFAVSRIFTDILAAAACTGVALAARVWVCPALNANTAIIGALMVLTPGVALTMGIRDFLNADYLSGAIRLFDAALIAGCLACGVSLAYMLARGLWGVLL